MDINVILAQLDQLFADKKTDEVETFIMEHITDAIYRDEHDVQIALMNELIGFYRSTGRHSDSITIVDQTLKLIRVLKLDQTEHYATTLLNGATAFREAGYLKKALSMYEECIVLYQQLLPSTDYRFAGLYNNMSGVYTKQKNYRQAAAFLMDALYLLKDIPDTDAEIAATLTNLAVNFLNLGDTIQASSYAEDALSIHHKMELLGKEDSHKPALLALCAQIARKKRAYRDALSYYQLAMKETKYFFGKNAFYLELCDECADTAYLLKDYTLEERYRKEALMLRKEQFQKSEELSGLLLSRLYYEEYGRAMIREKFPAYESRIAIGLAGHGSECFGFDDCYSMDHDYGPAFCMWLTKEDYDEIGEQLMFEYQNLPKEYLGYTTRTESAFAKDRVGALEINVFYQEFLGEWFFYENMLKESHLFDDTCGSLESDFLITWEMCTEHGLASATNGAIFRDDLGIFHKIRSRMLAYYPEELWKKKLAQAAAEMAQSGQYNYARCMRRLDTVAAQAALQEFIRSSISMVYLLNQTYMPYYKWMFRGMENLPFLAPVAPLIKKLAELPCQTEAWQPDEEKRWEMLNTKDKKVLIIEQICSLVAEELNRQQLSTSKDNYLEAHAISILAALTDR